MLRTIRFRLFATLALNLALLIALGSFATVLIGRVTNQARVIGEDHIPSLELLAQDITTVLLQGVAAERARVAILDITGVAAVDTHVLGLLLGAMRGAELLGARSLLAGISAEVAELIAAQGITLGNLSSYRDLRDAIVAALGISAIRQSTPTPRRAWSPPAVG